MATGMKTVRFLLPKRRPQGLALASCTTFFCLCNSFKELFSDAQRQRFCRKRVQRYGLFSFPANILRIIFEKRERFSQNLTKIRKREGTHYIYIKEGGEGNGGKKAGGRRENRRQPTGAEGGSAEGAARGGNGGRRTKGGKTEGRKPKGGGKPPPADRRGGQGAEGAEDRGRGKRGAQRERGRGGSRGHRRGCGAVYFR